MLTWEQVQNFQFCWKILITSQWNIHSRSLWYLAYVWGLLYIHWIFRVLWFSCWVSLVSIFGDLAREKRSKFHAMLSDFEIWKTGLRYYQILILNLWWKPDQYLRVLWSQFWWVLGMWVREYYAEDDSLGVVQCWKVFWISRIGRTKTVCIIHSIFEKGYSYVNYFIWVKILILFVYENSSEDLRGLGSVKMHHVRNVAIFWALF
jgi:hypothetical protein